MGRTLKANKQALHPRMLTLPSGCNTRSPSPVFACVNAKTNQKNTVSTMGHIHRRRYIVGLQRIETVRTGITLER